MAPAKKSTRVPAPPRRSADDLWVHDMHDTAARSTRETGVTAKPMFSGPPTNQLMVSNLHYEVAKRDLSAVFGQIGTLTREPDIRYDKSGRSTGIAVVTFDTAAEATRAKNQFQGNLAKNQPMAIEYHRELPRRRASAPSTLLKRIEKAPLLERLNKAEAAVAKSAKAAKTRGPASRRSKAPASVPARPKRERAKPKTAAELDNELDAFMGVDKPAESAPAKDANGDVEMA